MILSLVSVIAAISLKAVAMLKVLVMVLTMVRVSVEVMALPNVCGHRFDYIEKMFEILGSIIITMKATMVFILLFKHHRNGMFEHSPPIVSLIFLIAAFKISAVDKAGQCGLLLVTEFNLGHVCIFDIGHLDAGHVDFMDHFSP